MQYHFCTLFDKNYLTRGMALYWSLLQHCPDFRLWILCMDELTFQILEKMNLPKVELISLSEFEDKKLLIAKNNRTHGEYCWTCTPSLLLFVFKNNPRTKALAYLDSDLYFFSSPEPIYKEFGRDSILIIPHRFLPWKQEMAKKAGIYNVGMLIFRRDKNGLTCLRWWQKQCFKNCSLSNAGDQRYLDDFPKLFKKVHELQYIGGGVAPWNSRRYKVKVRKGKIYVDNTRLIFYHFYQFKIYEQSWFWPSLVTGPYTQISEYREVVYKLYRNTLWETKKMVEKYYSGKYNFGLENRPCLKERLKELISQKRVFLGNLVKP